MPDDTDRLEALNGAETERDQAYRERAHLLAWLAARFPSVITPAPDVDEPGWTLLYIHAARRQLSWHISPSDLELFEHVEQVPAEDPRAQWDGHTTDQKYERVRWLTRMTNRPADEHGEPICTCMYGQRCPTCPPDDTPED